jgi:outer membrane biosynthesis protein TonB
MMATIPFDTHKMSAHAALKAIRALGDSVQRSVLQALRDHEAAHPTKPRSTVLALLDVDLAAAAPEPEPEPEPAPEPEPEPEPVEEPAEELAAPEPEPVEPTPEPVEPEVQSDVPRPGDTIIVRHGGFEHEAVIVGFAMGVRARLKDGNDTSVFVHHSDWRPRLIH